MIFLYKDTFLIKDCGKTWGVHIDISPTILARDWKGWNTYGSVAVIEKYKANERKDEANKNR